MSRVIPEAMFAPLRQFPLGKTREAAPNTPFEALLDAPIGESQAAGNVSDSRDAKTVTRSAEEAEDPGNEEETDAGAVVAGLAAIVAMPVSAPAVPVGQDLTAPGDLVRASAANLGEAPAVSSPQNTALAALPGQNNNADAAADVPPPAPTLGQPESTSPPAQSVGIFASGLEAPPIGPPLNPSATQTRTSPATQEATAAATAPRTSPASGPAAALVAATPADEAESVTPSTPGPHTDDETAQPKSRGAGRESFDALVRKAAETSAPTSTQPPGDELPAALEAAKPGLDSQQLQASNTIPQPTPERFGHLTPAAPAAHTGQAATAETSAAVPVAGLAIEIAARAQSGHTRFELRLDPPELGRIDVRLDVDQRGHVTSRLVVEKSETLDLLKRDAPELERALQQAGLKTGDGGLQFALRDQAFAGRDDRQAPEMARVVVPEAELAPVEAVLGGYGRTLRLDGGLDIRV